jgi:hypothetical protein
MPDCKRRSGSSTQSRKGSPRSVALLRPRSTLSKRSCAGAMQITALLLNRTNVVARAGVSGEIYRNFADHGVIPWTEELLALQRLAAKLNWLQCPKYRRFFEIVNERNVASIDMK